MANGDRSRVRGIIAPRAHGPRPLAVATRSPGNLDEFVRSGPDLFSRHSPDGRFLEASPAASQLLGRPPATLVKMSWLDIVDESDRDRMAAWWQLVSKGPQPMLSFRARKPDGELVWLEAAAVGIRSFSGRVSELQVMARDVTRHVSCLEEARQQAERLERANRDLAAFAADVAHDLPSPLQAISGFAELLARREGARLDETSQNFIAHILSATAGIQELVSAMLEHRRSSSAALHPEPVDCRKLIRGVLMRLQGELDHVGAQVDIGDLPTLVADRVQLGRVFQNLISNALRATPPDETPNISITARRFTDAWELSVTDHGVGVPEQDRQRIFELFQQGTPTGDQRNGHGLGLAICRTVVERHGGRIGVERAAGGGSRFCFTVPDRLPEN